MITLQWSENALEFLREDIPGSETMTPVFSIVGSESDGKRMLALFSSATKKFYWTVSSGCSCCEELTSHIKSAADLNEGTESELKQALRAFSASNPSLLKDDEMQKIFSKIKKQK